MTRQIPFTKYEAALLLDAYLKVLSGELSRMDAIRNCSQILRSMAINSGIKIDDTYRNVNGISFQMSSMESAYQGRTGLKPASRLFAETVLLFRSDNSAYQNLLEEAKAMASAKQDPQTIFMSWLSDNVSKEQLPEVCAALTEIEQLAKKIRLIDGSLYDNLDADTIQKVKYNIEQSKFFKFAHKRGWGCALNYLLQYASQTPANDGGQSIMDADTFPDSSNESQRTPGNTEPQETSSVDDRWMPILQDSFPDGYILSDFLGQFQAAAFWQDRYGEECLIQGDAIDAAMKAIGVVRDGRVFVKSDESKQLISAICAEINDILFHYTAVYQSCIYDRYQEQLAVCSIYTEQVMTQQLLSEAKDAFYSTNQVFTKRGQYASVIQDARKVLRDYGGPMTVSDVAKVLWFIPYDTIYHCLSVDDESLNIGNSTWMLAEHFPLTQEDACKIGDMLDEYFLTSNYLQASDLTQMLKDRLPGIADDMNGFNYIATFNIVAYYLRDRFSFTKAIISPKGSSIDFTALFRSFAAERDTFTLADLETLASELKLPMILSI